MKILSVISVLIPVSFAASNGGENAIQELVHVYSGLLNSNFRDYSVFKGVPLDIFNPNLYDPKYFCESLAESVKTSIDLFLIGKKREMFSYATKFPVNKFKVMCENYPSVFGPLSELVSRIECVRLLHQGNYQSDYEAFKCNRQHYRSVLSKKPKISHSCLVTTLLLNENVDLEYIEYWKTKTEMKYTQTIARDERWKIFISDQNDYVDRISLLIRSLLERVTANLLRSKEGVDLLVKYTKQYGKPLVRTLFVNFALEKADVNSNPKITFDHFGNANEFYKGIEFLSKISYIPGERDYINKLPQNVLYLIFTECLDHDWFHVAIHCSRVCKLFHKYSSLSIRDNQERTIRTNIGAAKRFINDTIRPVFDPSNFKIGGPWNLTELTDIMSLCVLAMTAHSQPFTVEQLYNDYVSRCPEFAATYYGPKIFKRLPILMMYILRNHRFADQSQYLFFFKRVVSLPELVDFGVNLYMDGHSIATSLHSLFDDSKINYALSFDFETIEHVLSRTVAADRAVLLNKIMALRRRRIEDLYSYMFIKRHFGPGVACIDTFKIIAERAGHNPEYDLITDKKVVIPILTSCIYNLGIFEGQKDIQYLLDCIKEFQLLQVRVDENLLKILVEFMCKHRVSVEIFEHVLSLIPLTNAKQTLISDTLYEFAFSH